MSEEDRGNGLEEGGSVRNRGERGEERGDFSHTES